MYPAFFFDLHVGLMQHAMFLEYFAQANPDSVRTRIVAPYAYAPVELCALRHGQLHRNNDCFSILQFGTVLPVAFVGE
jgi:hypothetical protein